MNTFDAETNSSPKVPSGKKHQMHMSDSPTTLLPITPPDGQKQIGANKEENVIMPIAPLPSNIPALDERRTALLRRVTISSPLKPQPAQQNISPQLLHLIEHRAQIASQEMCAVSPLSRRASLVKISRALSRYYLLGKEKCLQW